MEARFTIYGIPLEAKQGDKLAGFKVIFQDRM